MISKAIEFFTLHSSLFTFLKSFIFYSSWISLQSFCQDEESTLQVVLLQHISHTYLVATCSRSGIETRGWGHHHGLALVFKFLKTPATELVRIIDRQLGYGIEGSHWDRRIDTRNAVESINQALTALYVLIIDIAIILLWCIKRCFCHNLTNQWRSGPDRISSRPCESLHSW